MEPCYTRFKAAKPASSSDEGDVEPDDVAPVAATHTISNVSSTPHSRRVRPEGSPALEPESLSTQSAGLVSIPVTSISEGTAFLLRG